MKIKELLIMIVQAIGMNWLATMTMYANAEDTVERVRIKRVLEEMSEEKVKE